MYKAVLKCKLCGTAKAMPNMCCSDDDIKEYAQQIISAQNHQVHTHLCPNGDIGVLDFVGFEKVKK